MSAAREAHRAYWHAQGMNPVQIEEQWNLCAKHDAWQAVAEAVAEPLRGEVARWKSAAEVANIGNQSLREELAEQKTLLSEALRPFHQSALSGWMFGRVATHVYERWLQLAGIEAP